MLLSKCRAGCCAAHILPPRPGPPDLKLLRSSAADHGPQQLFGRGNGNSALALSWRSWQRRVATTRLWATASSSVCCCWPQLVRSVSQWGGKDSRLGADGHVCARLSRGFTGTWPAPRHSFKFKYFIFVKKSQKSS